MKRKLLVVASIALLVASCGGPDKAAYDTAATTVCDCMSKKNAEAAADTSEFKIDFTDVNYALCILDVVGDVDPNDEQMGKSIEEKCPDLKEAHENYKKAAK